MCEMTVVTDDGVRLRARGDGRADAPALLLCNSLGTDLGAWDAQVATWAETHRVVRFDQRGHGGSQAPAGPYVVERLGCDACQVLDAFGILRADVCGISLGGLVALWVAARAPERVRRLVLADTAVRVGTAAAWRARADTVLAEGMDAVTGMVLDRFFSPSFRASADPAVARTETTLRVTSAAGYAASCEALASADLRDLAPRVQSPTQILVGTEDAATPPDDARELQGLLPDARLHELSGAGHLANLEQPSNFAELVARFLTATDLKGSPA